MSNIVDYDMRLKSLVLNFRQKESVVRGYNNFKRAANDSRKLAWLLRNHMDNRIESNEEVYFRDDMDFLLGYYSVVSCGLFSGYLSPALSDKIITEAKEVLDDPTVRLFYERFYPLILPQLLNLYINDLDRQDFFLQYEKESDKTDLIYESLLQLYRARIEDEDVNSFLFLLDDGGYQEPKSRHIIDLNYLVNIMGDPAQLSSIQFKKGKLELLPGLILGFSKFINYLNEYAKILRSTSNVPYVQSVFWQLDSYWFEKLHGKLGDVLSDALKNLQDVINSGFHLQYEVSEIDSEIIDQWRLESTKAIDDAVGDIHYLADKRLGAPIINRVLS